MIYWTADMKSSEAMIIAVMDAILAIAYRITGLNPVEVLNSSSLSEQLLKLRS